MMMMMMFLMKQSNNQNQASLINTNVITANERKHLIHSIWTFVKRKTTHKYLTQIIFCELAFITFFFIFEKHFKCKNPFSFSIRVISCSNYSFTRLHRYQLKDSLHRHLRHACRSNAAGHIAFDCYVCEKRFRYRFLVSDHIRKVHRIAPIRSKIKSCSTFR